MAVQFRHQRRHEGRVLRIINGQRGVVVSHLLGKRLASPRRQQEVVGLLRLRIARGLDISREISVENSTGRAIVTAISTAITTTQPTITDQRCLAEKFAIRPASAPGREA
jgi:hypothetical protein